MRRFKRIIAMLTLIIFTCTTTGCATSKRHAATSSHATVIKSQPSNVGKDQGSLVDESSNSNSSEAAVFIIAGIAVATVAVLFVVANLAAKGIGQGLAGSVASH